MRLVIVILAAAALMGGPAAAKPKKKNVRVYETARASALLIFAASNARQRAATC